MIFKEFSPQCFESLDELHQALTKIERRSQVVNPKDVAFHGDGRLAIGQDACVFTHSGARTLFDLLDVPERFVTRVCPPELAAHVVTDLLRRIGHPIELRLRDSVITSVHAELGPHLWHHELLDQCAEVLDDPVRIELSERGLRIATRRPESIEVEDDRVYFGHDVTHSEDSFQPLTASISLFREICSNGATIALRSQSYVADLRRTDLPALLVGLRRHLQSTIDLTKLRDMLEIAGASRSTSWERTRAEIRRVAGVRTFEKHPELQELHPRSSGYDVFNAITAVARDADVAQRQRLERLAGEFLVTIASNNGTTRSAWRRAELAMAPASQISEGGHIAT